MRGEKGELPQALRGVAALLAGVLGPHAEVVVHDCLLYTSPGQRTGRMAEK